MGEHTSKPRVTGEPGRSTLGELIHAAVREAIETAVEAELAATLGAGRYERRDSRRGTAPSSPSSARRVLDTRGSA